MAFDLEFKANVAGAVLQYMEYLQSKIPKVDFPPAKSEVGKVF
jgi:hypothetical protein